MKFEQLPKGWREAAEELGEIGVDCIKEEPGVYDYTCPGSEVPTQLIVTLEEGEKRAFLLPNPWP